MTEKARVEIEYCTGCGFLLRAAWLAQELLTSFKDELTSLSLCPGHDGVFIIRVKGENTEDAILWDRKTEGRFPEAKEIKQRLRDSIAPEKSLGHSDRK